MGGSTAWRRWSRARPVSTVVGFVGGGIRTRRYTRCRGCGSSTREARTEHTAHRLSSSSTPHATATASDSQRRRRVGGRSGQTARRGRGTCRAGGSPTRATLLIAHEQQRGQERQPHEQAQQRRVMAGAGRRCGCGRRRTLSTWWNRRRGRHRVPRIRVARRRGTPDGHAAGERQERWAGASASSSSSLGASDDHWPGSRQRAVVVASSPSVCAPRSATSASCGSDGLRPAGHRAAATTTPLRSTIRGNARTVAVASDGTARISVASQPASWWS